MLDRYITATCKSLYGSGHGSRASDRPGLGLVVQIIFAFLPVSIDTSTYFGVSQTNPLSQSQVLMSVAGKQELDLHQLKIVCVRAYIWSKSIIE